jgi:oligopeptidase B
MLGKQWYDDGKLSNKKNTFYDFIDVTKALTAKGYGDPKRVYAFGGSAGGLLVGAVANLAPELYHGIVAEVPFVDVLTTASDESIPLTSLEWSEWGNPITSKDDYQYILSYSPYDNVRATAYPNMLITTSLNDSQVGYFEAAKWTAKLRETVTGDNVIMLKTNMDAGHSGSSGRFKQFKDVAQQYTFICTLAGACEVVGK